MRESHFSSGDDKICGLQAGDGFEVTKWLTHKGCHRETLFYYMFFQTTKITTRSWRVLFWVLLGEGYAHSCNSCSLQSLVIGEKDHESTGGPSTERYGARHLTRLSGHRDLSSVVRLQRRGNHLQNPRRSGGQ